MAETPVMLAHEFKASKLGFPIIAEEKLDGIRTYFHNGKGYTRNNKTYKTLDPIAGIIKDALASMYEYIEEWGAAWNLIDIKIDCEVTAGNWNEVAHLIKRKKQIDYNEIKKHIQINIFDVFGISDIDNAFYISRQLLCERLLYCIKQLKTGYKFALVRKKRIYNQKQLDIYLQKVLQDGKEGLILKHQFAYYEYKRSYNWMKLKPFKDITATITGFECSEGLCPDCSMKISTGKKEGCKTCNGTGQISKDNLLGTFICSYKKKVLRVGTGITLKEREDFWAQREQLLGKKIDIKIQDDRSTNDILARHPVFMRIREDI